MNELLTEAKAAIQAEYDRAAKKYGKTNNSPHESYAVILEEVEEAQGESELFECRLKMYWASIKANKLGVANKQLQWMLNYATQAAAEWMQVAAMCYKAALSDSDGDTK